MDPDFMESVWWAFKKLYDAGKIYEGEKVLMYDTKFATPVSKAEVTMDNDAYQTVTDPSVYVKFKLTPESIGDKTSKLGLPVYFLAWTTTPWTLPADTALAVNPEMNYSEIKVKSNAPIFIISGKYAYGAETGLKEIKEKLEKQGHEVTLINHVNSDSPNLSENLENLDQYDFRGTHVITHSLGGVTFLKWLSERDVKVDSLTMIAPPYPGETKFSTQPDWVKNSGYTDITVDFEKVLSSIAAQPVIIHSDDTVMRNENFQKLGEELSAKMVYEPGKRHFFDPEYSFVPDYVFDFSEIFIMAKDLRDKVLIDDKKKPFEYEVIHDVLPGSKLVGKSYEPIVIASEAKQSTEKESMDCHGDKSPRNDENLHKVWPADFVSAENGTGIVHIAPAYGEDDFVLAKENNVPVQHAIDDNGYYFPEFAAELYKLMPWRNSAEPLEVWDANKDIAKGLKKADIAWKIEYIEHEYPFNPRSKQRIMYRAIPSWFFDIQNSKPLMLAQNENINWFPPHLKHGRFAKNIEQAPDWNLSRDRFWATAMPVWKGDRGTVRVVGSYAELEELSGKKLKDYHRPWVDEITFEIDGEKFTRIDKVLDGWFESGSMPFAQFHYPFENQEKFEKNYPGDFIVEYIGQVRAWFYYVHAVNTSLAEIGAFGDFSSRSTASEGALLARGMLNTARSDAPSSLYSIKEKSPRSLEMNAFKNVITTGTLAGNDGFKMSKSRDNFTDPNILMDEYSADSLRFLLMSSPVLSGEDFALKDKDVSDVARKLAMIWNMYDFFTMYAEVDGWEFANNVKIDYFVHGTTFDNENEIATGWNDGELSPLGIQQCKDMAKHLKGRKSDAIFCSDLGRAVESAKLFFPGAEIIPDRRLRECNYGDLNSKPADQVRDEDHIDVPFPNGESMRDVEKRMRELLESLGEKYAGKNVAILAHRAPQLALQVICDGLTWPESFEKDWRKTKNYQPGWEYSYPVPTPLSLSELKNPLDIWIVSRYRQLRDHITKYMDEYNIPDAMSEILPFVDDASNWFVRRSRRRFWKSEDDSDKNDAYRTLHYVLRHLSYVLAPFTPFLAEELYRKLTGGESVHLLDWPKSGEVDEKVLNDMARTREIINAGLALRMRKDEGRGEVAVKIRQPLTSLTYSGDKLNDYYEQIIADEVNVKSVIASNAKQSMDRHDDKSSCDDDTIMLDKKITPVLKREGLSREVIRFVQNARKQAGLNVDDRIKISLETDDAELKKAIDEWRETIANETLAINLDSAANKPMQDDEAFSTVVKIDEVDLKISLDKNK